MRVCIICSIYTRTDRQMDGRMGGWTERYNGVCIAVIPWMLIIGVAGLLAPLLRVTTKLLMTDDIRLDTFLFFFSVVVVLVVCCAVFLATVQTDFVQFYVQLYVAAVKDDEDRSSVECTTADEVKTTHPGLP